MGCGSPSGARRRGERPPAGVRYASARPDQQALDVAGAFVDLADTHVAVDALDREVGHVAVAAVDLDRVRADALGISEANSLAIAASFRQGWPASRSAAACRTRARAASICVAMSASRKVHRLVVEDRRAEALALLGVLQRRLERARAMPTDCAAMPMRRPRARTARSGIPPLVADAVGLRHPAVVEHDLRRCPKSAGPSSPRCAQPRSRACRSARRTCSCHACRPACR